VILNRSSLGSPSPHVASTHIFCSLRNSIMRSSKTLVGMDFLTNV
jgi:hypothetical protein